MTKGKVVLVPFPFDDLSSTKLRPAVCLTDPIGVNRHVVLAFITSQTMVPLLQTDIELSPSQPGFVKTGLRVVSILRLHRLMTISTSIIVRELGMIPATLQADIDARLKVLFEL